MIGLNELKVPGVLLVTLIVFAVLLLLLDCVTIVREEVAEQKGIKAALEECDRLRREQQ